MPRGRTAQVGDETVNALGYTQVKTEDRGWIGKHVLVLEEKLGRRLKSGERAIFSDNNRKNLDPSNIELALAQGTKSLRAKITRWKVEIQDREEWIAEAERQLANE